MNILALENSTTHGSVAFLADDQIMFEYENDRKHSGQFFQALKRLRDCFQELDTIVVGLGPGSYAGVRIAIATAIGLEASTEAKLVGLPSICAMGDAPNEYCVIGDARRGSFFHARIGGNHIVEGIDLYGERELRARLDAVASRIPIFCSEQLPQFAQATIRYPSALALGKLIEYGMIQCCNAPLEPIYLREPHITIPNDKRNLPLLG